MHHILAITTLYVAESARFLEELVFHYQCDFDIPGHSESSRGSSTSNVAK